MHLSASSSSRFQPLPLHKQPPVRLAGHTPGLGQLVWEIQGPGYLQWGGEGDTQTLGGMCPGLLTLCPSRRVTV